MYKISLEKNSNSVPVTLQGDRTLLRSYTGRDISVPTSLSIIIWQRLGRPRGERPSHTRTRLRCAHVVWEGRSPRGRPVWNDTSSLTDYYHRFVSYRMHQSTSVLFRPLHAESEKFACLAEANDTTLRLPLHHVLY